ncbi:rho guanine nucleotide exchange factor 16 isoform X2 [Alligator sinensis]|uniref:Rho guanine nucleotide exchange factor 16 isoform X2 n=1 Tax=Alligator sinensis TaxID=38654 RepID=A0A3Q0HBP5_ALLSI|nr:rho guanine nucleotide exchange factor 16 isoform X2 [Alligator sinensis]
MSQRRSEGEDKVFLVEHKFRSELHISPSGHRRSLLAMDNASFSPQPSPSPSPSPSSTDSRRIILSTESPAALKVGTQQMIPKSLAISSRPKAPARHQSFATVPPNREIPRCDPKRMSAPSISLDEVEFDAGGMLKRNLRNMSYRAAMKVQGGSEEPEPVRSIASLKPLEEGSTQPAQSPGRTKKTFGKRRMQRHGGSFKDDPRLYQEIRERGLNSIPHESDDDLLEEEPTPEEQPTPDAAIVVKSYRPAQMTWSQLPEVQEMDILDKISPAERKRQEAIFEIITSEYSYMRSLSILVCHFMRSEELKETMTQTQHHHLFSNIGDILNISKSFFEDLEKRYQEHILISEISDIMEKHALQHFHPYVIYCSNEVYQQRTLQKLLATNHAFKEALKQIERKPECGGLPMISFLILPMQRVTRLPLLMETVCQKTNPYSTTYETATQALRAISKLVKSCNEGAHTMERTEQMYTLQTQLEFGKIKPFPLISASRWLLKRGELALFHGEEVGIFRKGRVNCYLFLFNDVLIITKKKSEESYTVMDYAKLDQVVVEKIESPDPPSSPPGKPGAGGTARSPWNGHLFRVILKKNSEGRREEIVLSAESLSNRARWITALMHRENAQNDTSSKGGL